MKTSFDLELNIEQLARSVSAKATEAVARSIQEQFSYGDGSRMAHAAAAKLAAELVDEILTDPAFRAEMRQTIRSGVLAGAKRKAEKTGSGMNMQAALRLQEPTND